jgi:hypothetical protein
VDANKGATVNEIEQLRADVAFLRQSLETTLDNCIILAGRVNRLQAEIEAARVGYDGTTQHPTLVERLDHDCAVAQCRCGP